MSWRVYIAQAITGRYYIGLSDSVGRRIHKHNTHSGARFAKQQGPFKLVYISLAFKSKSEARMREMQIKKWARTKKEKLIKGEWF